MFTTGYLITKALQQGQKLLCQMESHISMWQVLLQLLSAQGSSLAQQVFPVGFDGDFKECYLAHSSCPGPGHLTRFPAVFCRELTEDLVKNVLRQCTPCLGVRTSFVITGAASSACRMLNLVYLLHVRSGALRSKRDLEAGLCCIDSSKINGGSLIAGADHS